MLRTYLYVDHIFVFRFTSHSVSVFITLKSSATYLFCIVLGPGFRFKARNCFFFAVVVVSSSLVAFYSCLCLLHLCFLFEVPMSLCLLGCC